MTLKTNNIAVNTSYESSETISSETISSENGERIRSSVSDSSPCDVMDLSIQIQRCESWDQLAELCVRMTRDLMGAIEVRWTEVSSDGQKALWACSASDTHAAYLRENLMEMLQRANDLGMFYQRVLASVSVYCQSLQMCHFLN